MSHHIIYGRKEGGKGVREGRKTKEGEKGGRREGGKETGKEKQANFY